MCVYMINYYSLGGRDRTGREFNMKFHEFSILKKQKKINYEGESQIYCRILYIFIISFLKQIIWLITISINIILLYNNLSDMY